jgi:hypothetical protein
MNLPRPYIWKIFYLANILQKLILSLTTDGVTQQTPIQAPNNCNGTQTQPSVADGTSSMPPYSAQDHTSDSMVEDGIFFITFYLFLVFICHNISFNIYVAMLNRL